jgi:hypothetical protein
MDGHLKGCVLYIPITRLVLMVNPVPFDASHLCLVDFSLQSEHQPCEAPQRIFKEQLHGFHEHLQGIGDCNPRPSTNQHQDL